MTHREARIIHSLFYCVNGTFVRIILSMNKPANIPNHCARQTQATNCTSSGKEAAAKHVPNPETWEHTYICIDLKTFYASVECVERGLDPFTTNLVVADPTRTEKTICLAITPAMKRLGIRNRCRIFEIPEGIEYITAMPRMKLYMRKSVEIYRLYLQRICPEDIHPYSIDECFIDATPYLSLYGVSAQEFAQELIDAVMRQTGITATAGIGSNLFLAKVALDVTAKHSPNNIGILDKACFKETLWHHTPLTDIWGIGPGIAARLARYNVHDLAGIAHMSKHALFREFGANAEFLIDHANGIEPCTMAQIKAYKAKSTGMGNGQVLGCACSYSDAKLILQEMIDSLVLDLLEKHAVAGGISLSVGYDKQAGCAGSAQASAYARRKFPAGYAGGQRKLGGKTASLRKISDAFMALFAETVDRTRKVKRLSIGLTGVMPEEFEEISLFDGLETQQERCRQQAILAVKNKFGANALLRGSSLLKASTIRERNEQVGGHHA